MPDEEADEAFNGIDRNITGVEWEAEIQELEANITQLNNSQYAEIADKEDDAENDTESTGVENDRKITGVCHNDEITGVDSDNKSTESGSTVAPDEADEMALIEEVIAEAEQNILGGTYLLAGTETETEDTKNKNVIHIDLQVPTVEHTYNFRRIRNPRPEYTIRYGFQDTIIRCALTQLSMKRGLKKFKQKGKKAATVELEQLHRRNEF